MNFYRFEIGKATRSAAYCLAILAITTCLGACDAGEDKQSTPLKLNSVSREMSQTLNPVADSRSQEHHYYFDVNDHTEDEVLNLLQRAQEIYDSLAAEDRDNLKIAMVLHGPDLQYFAKRNYSEHKDLVDTAAKLEALGFIDLKVCAVSARSHGVDNDGFPPFVDIVPYGPGEIRELEQRGYTKL